MALQILKKKSVQAVTISYKYLNPAKLLRDFYVLKSIRKEFIPSKIN